MRQLSSRATDQVEEEREKKKKREKKTGEKREGKEKQKRKKHSSAVQRMRFPFFSIPHFFFTSVENKGN